MAEAKSPAISKRSLPDVAIVGAGVSGVLTALALHRAGARVLLCAKGSDPRLSRGTTFDSATLDGEIGRFVTTFEGHPYLGSTPMYPDMAGAFRETVRKGGWLGKPYADFSPSDQAWLDRRQDANHITPLDSSRDFEWYVRSNRRGMALYHQLITELPMLFEGADLHSEGILRLYDDAQLFAWACQTHRDHDALSEKLSPGALAHQHPAFRQACEDGVVAGGIHAPGLAFNVRRFVTNVLNYIEGPDVELRWNCGVTGISRTDSGCVSGLQSAQGLLCAKHYSLHPGCYSGAGLLAGTSAAGALGAVAGRWLLTPRPEGINRPVKIHGAPRSESGQMFPVVDLNLTPFTANSRAGTSRTGISGMGNHEAKPMIAIGGGYVYAGAPPFCGLDESFAIIDSENYRAARLFLGSFFDDAQAQGQLLPSDRTCYRSFTSNDMPLELIVPTTDGGQLHATGGTNTGTTTLAPAYAEQLVRALSIGGR